MVARLRAKPGGGDIGVTIGDFATTRVDGTFSLAYLVFNTIMNLTTQAAQVACFRNVAAHLAPGGCFVIEVSVPDLRSLPAGQAELASGAPRQRRGRAGTIDRMNDPGHVFQCHHHTRPPDAGVAPAHP